MVRLQILLSIREGAKLLSSTDSATDFIGTKVKSCLGKLHARPPSKAAANEPVVVLTMCKRQLVDD